MRNTTWMLMIVLAMTIGAAGCGSDDNDISPAAPVVPVDPVDTAPPALPRGLTATYDPVNLEVVVTWNPNTTDADFANFLLTRASAGQEERRCVAMNPRSAVLETTEFVDSVQGDLGRLVTYRIASLDETGNMSAAAVVEVQIPRYTMAEL
jgi:hypothetical protein